MQKTKDNVVATVGTPQHNLKEIIAVGKVATTHGIKGWLKLDSESPALLINNDKWYSRSKSSKKWDAVDLENSSDANGRVLAKYTNCNDIDQAQEYVGLIIGLERKSFPELDSGTYYWCDLIGLDVIAQDNTLLGKVKELISNQANDLILLDDKQKTLIPLVVQHVKEVNFDKLAIYTNWAKEY